MTFKGDRVAVIAFARHWQAYADQITIHAHNGYGSDVARV